MMKQMLINIKIKIFLYRIRVAKRRGFYNSMDNPGPGQYAPHRYTNTVRPKTLSCKIGIGKRVDLNPGDKSTPEVGNYNISKNIGNGGRPKYTMIGKGNAGDLGNKNPGRGQYENTNDIYRKNPSWKIGTSLRDDELKRIKREGVPRPGNYEFDNRTKYNAPKYKFGSEKRGDIQKSDTPGPGQYRIHCSFDDINDYTCEQGNFNAKFRYI